MPILWRYLLSQYVKVLFLCTVAFIAILLTMRLEEIAHFATLGPEGFYILMFTLHQIPYVLPIAIPVSCLISATLLIQSLSRSHELSALRASGFAFRDILTPILSAAVVLMLFSFFVVSELSTQSHLSNGVLKSELRSLNPLLLLHNKHLMQVKGFYFDTLGHSRMGESASDIVLAMPNKSNSRLNLLIAKDLKANAERFSGKDLTLVTSLHMDDRDRFDHLLLENIQQADTSIADFTETIQKKAWALNNDHLRMSLLLVRLDANKQDLLHAQQQSMPMSEQKQIQRNINRGYSEMLRRFSIALATFTFTLMGAAFGVSVSRQRSHRGLGVVIALAALYLIAYFTAKGIDHLLLTAALLYLVPHLLIVILSIWTLRRAAQGVG